MSRWARRVDGSQQDVARTLRACGWWVCDLSRAGGGVPDLLIAKAGRLALVEVKTPKTWRGRQHTPAQRDFYANCPVPVVVLRTVDETLAWAQRQEARREI